VLPPVSDSANELALLKAAQDALIEDPRKALAIIDEDLRRYPGGVLRQEAEVIGIDALSRMGNVGAARARADKFRAMYPGSTHVRRIDAILGRTE
jgi:outer membrane protein assembly factor BamD (BamD/ComL family)